MILQFSKEMRLRKTPDFKRVFDARKVAADRILIVFALENGLDSCRLGLSVSKKMGNAVVRNRWKRLIREAFRKNHDQFSAKVDMVIVPQRGATKPDAEELARSLVKLVAKIERRSRGR